MKLKKKYKKQQDEIINKQLKKINKQIDKALTMRSGGYENYDKYNKLVQPLLEFQKLMKEDKQ